MNVSITKATLLTNKVLNRNKAEKRRLEAFLLSAQLPEFVLLFENFRKFKL